MEQESHGAPWPPAGQSPAQPHDGQQTFQLGCGSTSCASPALPCAHSLSAHPLWQLNCSSHTGRQDSMCQTRPRAQCPQLQCEGTNYLLRIIEPVAVPVPPASAPTLPSPRAPQLPAGAPPGHLCPHQVGLGAARPPQSPLWPGSVPGHLQGCSCGSNPRGNGKTPASPSVCLHSSAHTQGTCSQRRPRGAGPLGGSSGGSGTALNAHRGTCRLYRCCHGPG